MCKLGHYITYSYSHLYSFVSENIASLLCQREPSAILVFGNGECGQLGLGLDVVEKAKPAAIAELNNIIETVAGGMHTVCITSDFKVCVFEFFKGLSLLSISCYYLLVT